MQTPSLAFELATYLAGLPKGRPFAWSDNNCCHFAAGWVLHVTGWHPMDTLAPTPSALAALRTLRQLGGSLYCAWSVRLGVPSVSPDAADVGDLVLFTQQHTDLAGGVGALVGICAGGGLVACLAQDGAAVYLPQRGALCAWHLDDILHRLSHAAAASTGASGAAS